MSPNHTVKQQCRYRYYVSRIDGPADKAIPALRAPAGELEALVKLKLARWLGDREQVRHHCGEGASARELSQRLERCAQDAVELQHGEPVRQRALLLDYVSAVEVAATSVALAIRVPDERQSPVVLRVEASIVRAGRQVRLAITPGDEAAPAFQDAALIKLVARAHQARAALIASDLPSIEDAAASQGITCNYLCRLVRLSYLAPDIVATILSGRQPASLTRQRLARLPELPIEWQAQRELLGIA